MLKRLLPVLAAAVLLTACGGAATLVEPVATPTAVSATPTTRPSATTLPTATAQAPLPTAVPPTHYPAATLPPAETAPADSAYPATPAEGTGVPGLGVVVPGLGAPLLRYTVVAEFPHDRAAFTQGLDFDEDGRLYEGTGLWGSSSLRQVTLESGDVTQLLPLDAQYFGEGITVLGDRIYQITWQSNTGFVYDQETFELLETWSYPTEGWGLTHDGERLIMSDGSATITFRDPQTLEATGTITVRDANGPVVRLNELEYIDGAIWANIWQTDLIAIIDPQTGQVRSYLDLTGLLPAADRDGTEDVLNGIAYDATTNRLFVTGKLWPKLFQIEVEN